MIMPGTPCLMSVIPTVLGRMVTTLQQMGEEPPTIDGVVPIMLRSVEEWDQVATFVALTVRHGMGAAKLVNCLRHLAPDAGPRYPFLVGHWLFRSEENDPDWISASESSL